MIISSILQQKLNLTTPLIANALGEKALRKRERGDEKTEKYRDKDRQIESQCFFVHIDIIKTKCELYFSELVPIGLLESVADFGIANSIAIGEREQTISIARELGKSWE